MNLKPTIFVVDDDEDARESVCALARSMRLQTMGFASAEEFLRFYNQDVPGCLVTDVRMLGMSGIELQEQLLAQDLGIPVIVLTAYARTALTVRAMNNGAVTMLDKPYNDDDLWDAIRQALNLGEERRVHRERKQELVSHFERLTPAERSVMEMVVAGSTNKVIAMRLDVSVRTVENRRQQVFEKMEADSVAELVQMSLEMRDQLTVRGTAH